MYLCIYRVNPQVHAGTCLTRNVKVKSRSRCKLGFVGVGIGSPLSLFSLDLNPESDLMYLAPAGLRGAREHGFNPHRKDKDALRAWVCRGGDRVVIITPPPNCSPEPDSQYLGPAVSCGARKHVFDLHCEDTVALQALVSVGERVGSSLSPLFIGSNPRRLEPAGSRGAREHGFNPHRKDKDALQAWVSVGVGVGSSLSPPPEPQP